MKQEDTVFLAGQIIGMALRASVQDFEAAAEMAALTAGNRALVRMVAELRRQFDVVLKGGADGMNPQ